MSDDPIPESDIAGDHEVDSQPSGAKLDIVFERAMARFDSVALPQQELRAQSLADRRFVTIAGAQWEDGWAANWADGAPKPEIDKISQQIDKIDNDYRQSRLMVNYRPADEGADEETADLMDGLYRADDYRFKGMQARDNGFMEALLGGFGAYRAYTDYVDRYDKDNDYQCVCPAATIPDADQRVYFDPASPLYDKSDAQWAFIIHADPRATAAQKWGEENLAEWPLIQWRWNWDWYRLDTVQIAEYYEVEDKNEKLLIFTNELTDEEQRYFISEMEEGAASDLKAQGWKMRSRTVARRRVHKYIMNGTKVLKDCGFIAGEMIPIIPIYGNRVFADGMERWWGYVRKRVDSQRSLNTSVAGLLEIDSLSPREIPIFDPEQITPAIAEMWASQNIDRHPYALAKSLRNEDGSIAAMGPIGKVTPPGVPAVKAALLQLNLQILTDDNDNADEVKANVSEDAMALAAQRIDAKSGRYLDNMRQSVQREGEIYLSAAREIYIEPGRKVKTRTIEGESQMQTLSEPVMDKSQVFRIRNDLTNGRYDVVTSVQEATATKRDKAVRAYLNLAQVAGGIQDMQSARVFMLLATENTDGEGAEKAQKYAHTQLVSLGVDEPTDEERQEMEQAQQQQQPDPAAQALLAQGAKFAADAQKAQSEVEVNEAKKVQILSDAGLKDAQRQALGGPESAPKVPTGLEAPAAIADINAKQAGAELHRAQALHLNHDIAHKDRTAAIAAHKAETDRQKITIKRGHELGPND